ncbi:MAG: alpha/beta hydrolase fold [Mycobacterium sp.]|jgi:pimeloyl-ACP methyl ester carboxylesterase|nr:alpha/beta hydrolase fold [Mycobacterium sp.]
MTVSKWSSFTTAAAVVCRPNGYSIDGWADEPAELLDRLEVARTVVVGHSLGSMIAQRFAAKYSSRVRALVLAAGGEAELGPNGKKT